MRTESPSNEKNTWMRRSMASMQHGSRMTRRRRPAGRAPHCRKWNLPNDFNTNDSALSSSSSASSPRRCPPPSSPHPPLLHCYAKGHTDSRRTPSMPLLARPRQRHQLDRRPPACWGPEALIATTFEIRSRCTSMRERQCARCEHVCLCGSQRAPRRVPPRHSNPMGFCQAQPPVELIGEASRGPLMEN